MQISLITVTYNCVAAFQSTIESIRKQSFKNIEYIVVDGGSNDGTNEIIKENEDIINQWISEPDHGIYDAMNKGLKLATGDIIGFLHADDRFSCGEILSEVTNCFISKECDFLYGDLQYVSQDSSMKVIRHWVSGDYSLSKLRRGWMPPHPTVYFRKSLLDSVGFFNTNYRIAADYDWMMRALLKSDLKVYYLPKVMVLMPTGGASNRSLKNIIRKSSEDYKIMKMNNIGGFSTLIMKNFSKLGQFFR